MTYGFYAKGSAGNLIIGDENKVLVLKYSKDMQVTRSHAWTGTAPVRARNGWTESWPCKAIPQGYGFVEETYPSPITTEEPPYIFGTPNGKYNGGGLGAFVHVGQPGYWVGFQMIFAYDLYYTRIMSAEAIVGQETGWTYHICTFGDAPSKESYGLRLWNSKGDLTFDSGWKIVPFRGLLSKWTTTTDRIRYYNITHYWGRRMAAVSGVDFNYQAANHSWGYQNHEKGVLLSSMHTFDFVGDVGNHFTFRCFPIIGFLGRDRSVITCSIAYGVLQHPGPALGILDAFQILTADFSKAYKPPV